MNDPKIIIEPTHDFRYRVVEIFARGNGYFTLGVYDDMATAERRAEEWRAELREAQWKTVATDDADQVEVVAR